ncbi:hypothetical protein C8R44DRAFT_789778 [Mycena epipterygia]|nr:hypothetical protein C8R44DRAFT_789778 [Mycena epipterygia]
MGNSKQRKKIELMQAANNQIPYDKSIPLDGWFLVAWDCCLACLAISVKLHRDVLEPLNPVFSWEFQGMAPHEVSYDELETAQRDVLSAFSYCLGGTPQQILDELWIALPSLQELLNFRGGWKYARKEVWWRLFDAVEASDVLKFPVSLLSVAALVEALLTTLADKYESEASLNSLIVRRPNKNHADTKKQKLVEKAESEMEGVVQDIQAVVGISDERLGVCRSWLRATLKDSSL